ncbi:MAG: DUF1016 family protein [Bacilli bacterium]|nr:DUF1016 family protein [Bacilli bacterium]
MNYYEEIKESLINNEITKKVKDYSKNKSDLETYYKVGKMLSEAGKHYGERIINKYSIKLISELDKKYNTTLLKRIRQFYYMVEKGATLSHLLSFSHYVEIIPLENINIINYYINLIEKNNLSVRDLRKRIKSKEYERLPEETKNKLINKERTDTKELIKEPIIIKSNLIDKEQISEKMLQKIIVENISEFMEELGSGYSFIKNEYKIKIGETYNYIDLLLYNIQFNCYVIIELKITELKKEHIGQIEVYMNYIDENIKTIYQNNTIGLILVKENNQFIIKYSSDDRIISRVYYLL